MKNESLLYDVPSALIMRFHDREIEVFETSHGENTITASMSSDLIEAVTLLSRNLENAAKQISSYQKLALDQSRGGKKNLLESENLHNVLLSMKYELKSKNVGYHISSDENIEIDSYSGLLPKKRLNCAPMEKSMGRDKE